MHRGLITYLVTGPLFVSCQKLVFVDHFDQLTVVAARQLLRRGWLRLLVSSAEPLGPEIALIWRQINFDVNLLVGVLTGVAGGLKAPRFSTRVETLGDLSLAAWQKNFLSEVLGIRWHFRIVVQSSHMRPGIGWTCLVHFIVHLWRIKTILNLINMIKKVLKI